jgi:hypothetical protein
MGLPRTAPGLSARARRSFVRQPADQVTSAAATMSMRDGSMYCIDM